MPFLESLVTNIYRRRRESYHKNNGKITFLHQSQDKARDILASPDWLLMDYDATVIDNSALQTVLAVSAKAKPISWYVKTGLAYLRGGKNKVINSFRDQKTDSPKSLKQLIDTFQLGGKEQESVCWESFCKKYLVKIRDAFTGNPTSYRPLAKRLNWTPKRATHLMYPGAISFTRGLLETNEELKVGVITRNIKPIVRAGYQALGLENNITAEFYLTNNKANKVDQLDLKRGQKVVYLWDSNEDTVAVRRARELVGQENVLSVQVVANETEIDPRYADIVIFKNYTPINNFVAAARQQSLPQTDYETQAAPEETRRYATK